MPIDAADCDEMMLSKYAAQGLFCETVLALHTGLLLSIDSGVCEIKGTIVLSVNINDDEEFVQGFDVEGGRILTLGQGYTTLVSRR